MDKLINGLIIAAGQWDKFKEKRYATEFEALFEQLKKMAGVDDKDAERILLDALNEERAA